MLVFIKYFSIILCSFYSFEKLLNLSKSRVKFFTYTLFTICLSSLASLLKSLLRSNLPFITTLVLILISIFLLTFVAKISPELTITTTIIAYGISHVTFTLAVTVTAFIFSIFTSFSSYNHTISQILAATIQVLITTLLFRFKRLKKGMPFLTNRLSSTSFMLISIAILFVTILSSSGSYNHIYVMPFLSIFLLAIFIYVFWKNHITKTYLDKLKEQDINTLNSSLAEKDIRIRQLEEENKELAKIIHGDNKLIPAMALAVESFIQDTSSLSPAVSQTGNQLLNELNRMSANRKGIIHDQDFRCRIIPSTNVPSVDNLLKYMQQKAYEMDIDFNVSVSCSLKSMIHKAIAEDELKTLLADLLENALIATKYNYGHHVLLNIDLVEKFYVISIFDSGVPFSQEVLFNLGLKNYTTHENDGGSGIGLVTSYEIIQKYNASLAIDEYAPKSGLYAKKVSVTFNHMRQYALYTYRDSTETALLRQRADLSVIQKTMPAAI